MTASDPAESDLETVGRQLGRPARGVHAVAHRCPCGLPDVVATEPRLRDGTPFPTTFYLTCPRAASRIGSLEGAGLMKDMEARLGADPALAAAYAAAHERYLAPPAPSSGERPGDRRHLGRRHARPGQVPARAGRAGAGPGPRREPARRRGARRAGDWWAPGPCVGDR